MSARDDELREQARAKLDELAALSGWTSVLEALDVIASVDSFAERNGETVQ